LVNKSPRNAFVYMIGIFTILIVTVAILFFRPVETEVGHRTASNLRPARGRLIGLDATIRAQKVRPSNPMSFELNEGQEDPEVKYISRGSDYRVFLTQRGATFAFRTAANDSTSSLAMQFNGGNRHPKVAGFEKLLQTSNYFVGRDPSTWKSAVPEYTKVEYNSVYPGIDLIYYGKDHQLEYDFIVKPTARPSDIRISFSGPGQTAALRIDQHGDLIVPTSGTDIHMPRPVAYQRANGREIPIDVRYVIGKDPENSVERDQELRLEVGEYDRSKPLVIDPVLAFSTFLGGSLFDQASGVAVDGTGNVYVVGQTLSMNFPTQNALQPTIHGIEGDAFVTKFDPSGSTILYSTYLGGSNNQAALAVAVDQSGNAYVAGVDNSNDFPFTPGAFDTSCTIGSGFLVKLNSSGSEMLYSTCLPDASILAVAIDASGSAFVTGSASSGFPTTPGSFQVAASDGSGQAYVTKFNPTGSALVYSTYLGSGVGDGIAVNGSGIAYVAGDATEPSFPTTPGAFQTTFPFQGPIVEAGTGPVFISEFNATGSALLFSTFLGGSEGQSGGPIAIDAEGNAYVTGQTFSKGFPLKNPFVPSLKGQGNAYAAKLNPNLSALVYSTYLGGSNNDAGGAIAVDSVGNAYITGFAQSSDFPVVGALQGTLAGPTNAFLTVIDSNGLPSFSTFLGGTGQDQGAGIALDSAENVYIAGRTTSSDFPVLNAFQGSLAPNGNCPPTVCADAFVTKISISTATPPTDFSLKLSPTNASISPGQELNFDVALIPAGGFSQTVSLGCSIQPVGPTCTVVPPILTSDGITSPVAFANVASTASSATSSPITIPHNWITTDTRLTAVVFTAVMAAICIVIIIRRREIEPIAGRSWIGIVTLLMIVGLLQACGGGSSGGGTGNGGGGGTSAGSYTVTITGTAGNLTHAQLFALTIN
jgi:hypothetical protein